MIKRQNDVPYDEFLECTADDSGDDGVDVDTECGPMEVVEVADDLDFCMGGRLGAGALEGGGGGGGGECISHSRMAS